MEGSIVYEPRSLWSIANTTVQAQEPDAAHVTTVNFNRQHFTNRTKWPMYLDRVAMCGVNYILDRAQPASLNANFLGQGNNVVATMDFNVSAPFRYRMTSKSRVSLMSLTPRPTWEPTNPLQSENPFADMIGTCQLKFQNDFFVPKTAAIEWQLSSYTPFCFSDTTVLPPNLVFTRMLYQEEGGFFMGSARVHKYVANYFNGVPPQDSQEKWPYPWDGLANIGNETFSQGIDDWWDPKALFSAKSFRNQNSTRDGSTKLTDMRVAIDQRQYDTALAAFFQEVWEEPIDGRPSTLFTRIGSRVRTVGFGSGAWWWRPGAPIALVFDTITPALVYTLPEVITLEPGDTLEVSLTLPANPFEGEGGPSITSHIGIAFNGFSPVQG